MSDTPRSKGTDSPLCKICGHRHRFADAHVFGGKPTAPSVKVKATSATPTLAEIKEATAALERAFPSEHAKKPDPGSSNGRTADFDSANARSSRAPGAKAKKKTIAVLGELVVAASDRIASKPTKPKRKKPVVAKDGTNRGRPANVTKGKEPFDKKAHDRAKSKERREAKKAESAKVQP